MERIIGIRHRRKKTAEGEARPTTLAIKIGKDFTKFDLDTETSELDFLMARFPVEWKPVGEENVVWFNAQTAPKGLHPHQCKWKKISDEEVAQIKTNHVRQSLDAKGFPIQQRLTKVPCKFDGLQKGDKIGMVLGGSGDRFAAALSRRGEEVGANVYRLPPASLKNERGNSDKDDDHVMLASLLAQKQELFYHLGPKDRLNIGVKEALSIRMQAQQARIGCEQRIHQALVGKIFLDPDGRYPEGVIEDEYDNIKANDIILQNLDKEEKRRDRELKSAVQRLEVWSKIFAGVEGCGERIAAGLIAGIGDIRRFAVMKGVDKVPKTLAKVKAFCGVGPRDGVFQRRRKGQTANYNPPCRQALNLLGDQLNRRPGSFWGAKLIEAKKKYRQTHPEPIVMPQRLAELFRSMERVFGRHGVNVPPENFKVETAGSLLSWFQRNILSLVPMLRKRFSKQLTQNQDTAMPQEADVDSIDKLYTWFRSQIAQLGETKADLIADQIDVFEEEMERVQQESANGKTAIIYTAGHIHRMSMWRTATKFIEWTAREWLKLEKVYQE